MSGKPVRKLAAIMFTDMVGFTSIMGKDESSGREKIRIYREILEEKAGLYSGNILQHQGDGSLIIFDSGVEAVGCARDIQLALKKPRIPLRIGIHLGDIVVDGDEIYGDSVNIASRVQAIGKPGSVLFTDRINQDLASHPEFHSFYLGKLSLKNVARPQEIFALSIQGYSPLKPEEVQGQLLVGEKSGFRKLLSSKTLKWAGFFIVLAAGYLIWNNQSRFPWESNGTLVDIKNEGIAVMPFANLTGDQELDFIGTMFSDHLSTALKATGEVFVLNAATFQHSVRQVEVIKSQLGYSPEFRNFTGVKYLLEGRYYLRGDSLAIYSQIVDAVSGDLQISPDIIWAPRNDPWAGLSQLHQTVLGYWISRNNPLFSKRVPKADPYKEYYKAIRLWEDDYGKVLGHLKACQTLDSTFIRAYLLEIAVYMNLQLFDKADSLTMLLEKRKLEFEENELNLFLTLKADLAGNNKLAHEFFLHEYHRAPNDIFVNTAALFNALVLVNDPDLAIEIGEKIDGGIINFNLCSYCLYRQILHSGALIDAGRYNDALEIIRLTESKQMDVISLGLKEMEIRALARLGEREQIDQLIEKAKDQKLSWGDYRSLYATAAREFSLLEEHDAMIHYAGQGIETFRTVRDVEDLVYLGDLYMLTGEFEKAESSFESYMDKSADVTPLQDYVLGQLGITIAYLERESESLKVIEQLENRKQGYHKGVPAYHQSRILVSMGHRDNALRLLKESISQGKLFYQKEFLHDPAFISIMDDPEFQNLLNTHK